MNQAQIKIVLTGLVRAGKPPLDRVATRARILSAADALAEGQSRLIGAAAVTCMDPRQAWTEAMPTLIQSISVSLDAVSALYGVTPTELVRLLELAQKA